MNKLTAEKISDLIAENLYAYGDPLITEGDERFRIELRKFETERAFIVISGPDIFEDEDEESPDYVSILVGLDKEKVRYDLTYRQDEDGEWALSDEDGDGGLEDRWRSEMGSFAAYATKNIGRWSKKLLA